MCMGCSRSLTHTQTGHELLMDSIGSSWISFLIRLLFPTNLYAQGTSNPLAHFLLPVTSHVTHTHTHTHPMTKEVPEHSGKCSLGTCPTAQLSFIKHTAHLSWVLLSSHIRKSSKCLCRHDAHESRTGACALPGLLGFPPLNASLRIPIRNECKQVYQH